MAEHVIEIRARAFNGALATHRCILDADGTVRVYDPVAGHYTRCHSMPPRDQARARKLHALAEVNAMIDGR